MTTFFTISGCLLILLAVAAAFCAGVLCGNKRTDAAKSMGFYIFSGIAISWPILGILYLYVAWVPQ